MEVVVVQDVQLEFLTGSQAEERSKNQCSADDETPIHCVVPDEMVTPAAPAVFPQLVFPFIK